MTSTHALAALPGSSSDPGRGPVVVELVAQILDDGALTPGASADQVTAALHAHREHRTAWYTDLVGPLLVPADTAENLAGALLPADRALRILLVAGSTPAGPEADRQVLRAARDVLAEDDRVEIVGVRLGLPTGPADHAAARLLATLDFTAPAWIELVPGRDDQALPVIARDGAENATVRVDGASPHDLARTLRQAVDDDVSIRLAGRTTALAPGWLNALAAVRAALNGAVAPEVAEILAATDPAVITSGLRRMSEADAAVTRAFVAGVEVADVAAAVAQLTDLGLVAPA